MIQRIQSVYLLLVAVLMGITLVAPLISFTEFEHHQVQFSGAGILFAETFTYLTWGTITIGLFSALLAFVEIFLYKKRRLQVKLSNINTLLLILFYVTVAVYAYVGMQKYNLTFAKIDYGLIFPFIALILNILAKKKIQQDEKLVRSLDRIR